MSSTSTFASPATLIYQSHAYRFMQILSRELFKGIFDKLPFASVILCRGKTQGTTAQTMVSNAKEWTDLPDNWLAHQQKHKVLTISYGRSIIDKEIIRSKLSRFHNTINEIGQIS